MLETVNGVVRRLSKISNCAFECDYYYYQGSHLRKKTAFFTQKKSRLRKSENAMRLLYAKNSDLTHQNAF